MTAMNESDGMNEILDDAVRQAVMLAARLGEQIARHRQEQLMASRQVSEQAGRAAQARFEAERLSARTAVAAVREPSWWKDASAEQIGAAYQTTSSWREQDSEIAEAHMLIERKLSERGVSPSGSPETLTELIRAREWATEYEPDLSASYARDLIQPGQQSDRERQNNALVAAYLARPESQSSANVDTTAVKKAESNADAEYDSADRRAAFANTLSTQTDPSAKRARLLADISQGTPATTAVAGQRPHATKARKTKAMSGPNVHMGGR